MTIDIQSGTHHGEPVGQIPGPNGTLVLVWSLEPVDLLCTMLQAIGPLPTPPDHKAGGQVVLQPGDCKCGIAPQAIYNPAGDVLNQSQSADFEQTVVAWNVRAQAIQAVIMATLVGKNK